jgi:hypothetical protein
MRINIAHITGMCGGLYRDAYSVCRLEGFTEPWDWAMYQGKEVAADTTLAEAGITDEAPLITVRRALVPEGKPAFHCLIDYYYEQKGCGVQVGHSGTHIQSFDYLGRRVC